MGITKEDIENYQKNNDLEALKDLFDWSNTEPERMVKFVHYLDSDQILIHYVGLSQNQNELAVMRSNPIFAHAVKDAIMAFDVAKIYNEEQLNKRVSDLLKDL